VFALASCSPGALGGIRGLNHVRDILVSIGADVLTPQLCVSSAFDAFDDRENLTNPRHQQLLQNQSSALMERVGIFARD